MYFYTHRITGPRGSWRPSPALALRTLPSTTPLAAAWLGTQTQKRAPPPTQPLPGPAAAGPPAAPPDQSQGRVRMPGNGWAKGEAGRLRQPKWPGCAASAIALRRLLFKSQQPQQYAYRVAIKARCAHSAVPSPCLSCLACGQIPWAFAVVMTLWAPICNQPRCRSRGTIDHMYVCM